MSGWRPPPHTTHTLTGNLCCRVEQMESINPDTFCHVSLRISVVHNCMQLWSARVLPLFITRRSYISYIVSYHWAIACCVVLHDHLVYFHTAKTNKQTNKQTNNNNNKHKTLVAARHQCVKRPPPREGYNYYISTVTRHSQQYTFHYVVLFDHL